MPSGSPPLRLETQLIGPLPIINHFLSRLHVEEILGRAVCPPNSRTILPAKCLGVLIRNIIIEREPVYGLQEWASLYLPAFLGLTDSQVSSLNDDRIGRSLDMLFDADRASLLTEIVVRAVKEFKLDLSQLHNDATSITFSGFYADAQGENVRGKKSLKIARGRNKDHRFDLKQLMWFLTVTSDGAVPIHYKACDGNTPESPTHRETWDVLRALAGRHDFIYVADCKLCCSDTMRYIDSSKGRFITVLPRNRSEDGWFRNHIQTNKVNWTAVAQDIDECTNVDNPEVWRMVESPLRSSEGFRIVWAWSSEKQKQDKETRQSLIGKAVWRLEQLETRLRSPKCHLRARDAVVTEADAALGEIVNRWIEYEIIEEKNNLFQQMGPGRPSPETAYKRSVKTKFHVNWHARTANIAYDARSDGMFPLITNCEDLALKNILDKYKFQPRLEKRHEQFKTVYEVAPVLLKSIARIEGLLFVFFLAMLVQALIEREIRVNMKQNGFSSIPVYPEDRECEAPTTDKILKRFNRIEIHKLWADGKIIETFRTNISLKQIEILRLAGVPIDAYSLIG